MPNVVTQNPATVTAALMLILTIVGGWLGWSTELQAQVAQLGLALAVLVRACVAWWQARHPAPQEG